MEKKSEIIDQESSSSVSSSEASSIDSDIDTEELEEREAEYALAQNDIHAHGFMYAADLDTYRLNKRERVEKVEREKELNGKKVFESSAAKRRNKKDNGSTNVEKLKNKPMNMLLPKKAVARAEKRDGKLRSVRKSEMKQLGHFKKNQKQRIDSKKKRRIT